MPASSASPFTVPPSTPRRAIASTRRARSTRLAALLLITACGGGGGDSPTPPPVLAGVTVSPTTLAIQGVGGTATLSAALQPAGVTAAISYSSSNAAVATVTGSGSSATVTAVGGGSAQITARAGTFSATATVTVTPVVRSITLPADTLRLSVSDTASQLATVTADAGANTALTWSSAVPAVASVNEDGLVTALTPGTTVLTATAMAFPQVTATRAVRVLPPDVAVEVTPDTATLFVNDSTRLIARVIGGAGANSAGANSAGANSAGVDSAAANSSGANSAGVDTTITWTSRAPAVASIRADGTVSALTPGTATIVATSVANPDRADSARITVVPRRVRSLVLTPAATTLTEGATRQLTATIVADPGADTSLTWMSGNTAVATVSGTGLVTAVAAGGPITITATAGSVPGGEAPVSATAMVTVEALPTGAFVTQPALPPTPAGGYGGTLMAHFDADHVVVGVGFQGGGAGTFANGVFRVDNGVSSEWPVSCCTAAGLVSTIAADSPSSALIAFSGDFSFDGGPPRVVYRTPTQELNTNWTPPTTTVEFVQALRDNGDGTFTALTSRGAVQRYTRATNEWVTLGTIGFAGATSTGESVFNGASEVVALACNGMVPELLRWTAIAQTVLPAPPGACATNPFDTSLWGRALDGALALNTTGLHRYTGGAWQTIAPGVTGTDTLRDARTCAGTHYATALRGRVYMLQGALWQAIGEPATITALKEFNSRSEIDCAPDGPLRVLSGGARLMRREGGGWVEENYAPRLNAVHLSSASSGFAVGDGVAYRWNGTQWTRAHLFTSPDLRLTAVVSSGPNHALAIGQVRRESGTGLSTAGMLQFDGTTWQATVLPQFSLFGELVSLGGTGAMVVDRAFGSGGVARFDGTTWTPQNTGITREMYLSASAPDHVIVMSDRGDAARYDGATWTVLPSIPGTFQAFTGDLYVASPTFAMAGGCNDTVTRLVRWNGTSWADTPTGALPPVRCVLSLFGTGATDVFALVDAPDRQLWHWDGTAWSVVDTPPMDLAEEGSAVTGVTVLVGRRAFTAVSRRPLP